MPQKLSDEEFYRIYHHIKQKYGIDLSKKKVIIEGRLENYLIQNGYHSYSEYMNAVEADISGKMEDQLVDFLTTNHTYFMRESEHFDYFKGTILPELKQKHQNDRDLRIWCGASSSGEEPYTLAMIMEDYFGLEASKWDKTILATDVSVDILKIAVRGEYTSEQVMPLPDNYKRRFLRLDSVTGNYKINEDLKKQVLYRQFNLMDPFPFRKKLDVVFLRNVLIYFEEPTKNAVVKKIYDNLNPGGYMFLGKTETIHGEDFGFSMVYPSVFRKGTI